MPREIKVYSTLSRKKQSLSPVKPGHVGIYACGVTVYDDNHIGHAMQAIFFDVIRTYLEYAGYKVTYVRNYTDVDDKIINRANELGISPRDLSEGVIQSSIEDLAELGVKPATFEPKVSESIPEIIAMINDLVEKGAAYPTKTGDVYYRVRNNPEYGKLSNRKVDELKSGTRDVAQGEKEDALDFALWKQDDTQDASWDSPWGKGRPGWHIECSAMSKKFLGPNFDIHGGGLDLVFPHHENEIAQSESANGCAYANVWMHSGLLTINRQKMSKSLGNFITIKDFLKKWPGEVLRLGYLQNHYSSNIDFSEEIFKTCRKRLLYYYETMKALKDHSFSETPGNEEKSLLPINKFRDEFHRHMSENFNTPGAIACINDVMKQANQLIKKKKNDDTKNTVICLTHLLTEWGQVLGLFQREPSIFIESLKQALLPDLGIDKPTIDKLVADRWQARQDKDWKRSDEIRDELRSKGIIVNDGTTSSTWTIAQLVDD
ncbi:MAG: cysteine--tRNA ligase [Oligoflexales bacterium]|nr:cysteine--tRNA ligase [Oligoflexales bacterium]